MKRERESFLSRTELEEKETLAHELTGKPTKATLSWVFIPNSDCKKSLKRERLKWNKLSCIVGVLFIDKRNQLLDGAGEKGSNRMNGTSI